MQRIPFPADVCPEPTARYRRTLLEAFPCDARQAVAFHRPSKRSPRWPLVLAALLAGAALAMLAGCSAQAADTPATTAADLKRAAAGAWLCPGMTAVWLDPQTVQCLKDRQ